MLATSCGNKNAKNPLLAEWDTPFMTIPFNDIKTSDYEPAIKEAIKMHNAEIDSIVNNTEEPSFENTIAALDYSGAMLNRVSAVYFNMSSCNTNDEMEKLSEKISPMIADHEAEIKLNEKLFNRIKVVWDKRESLSLTPEDQHLLKKLTTTLFARVLCWIRIRKNS